MGQRFTTVATGRYGVVEDVRGGQPRVLLLAPVERKTLHPDVLVYQL